jgi:ATP-dependent DNA helicase 2 subunit 2
MDALIVGADLLMTMTGRKKTFEKKIFLFTDPSASKSINSTGLDQIISQLNDHEINLNIILLKTEANDDENISGNNQVLKEFCEQVSDGAIYSIDEALGMLQKFMTKRVRQVATFRGSLTISPNEIEIPINLFTKTLIQRLPPAKKYSPYGRGGEGGVERDLKYLEIGSSSSFVKKDDLAKAYRYGRSLVPFHKIDEAQMQFKTKKSFQVLGFIPASKIDRESFMSGVYAIVGEPGNVMAQKAISALARALYEKDCLALVRYVRAENNSPKLGILQPRIKATYESLLFNVLPYSEDHRRYTFASFPSLVNLTAEQDAAMRDWISAMDLMEAARDEDGEPMEAMRPGDTFNITFQAHYSAVQNRALRPEAPLLSPDPSLLKHLTTPQSLLESSSETFQRIKQLFPLKTKKSVQLAEQVPRLWASANEPLTTKSFDDEDDEVTAQKSKKRKINPENPLPDFRTMISDKHEDLVETALMQLMELIPKYVEEEGKIDLAFECFKELREAALKVTPEQDNILFIYFYFIGRRVPPI